MQPPGEGVVAAWQQGLTRRASRPLLHSSQRFSHADRHADTLGLRDAARRSPVAPEGGKELKIIIPTLRVNTTGERRGRDDVDF